LTSYFPSAAGAPQFYPSCSQIIVKGSGNDVPAASELYSISAAYEADKPAILFNIWGQWDSYTPAGPKVVSFASGGGSDTPTSTPDATSSTPANTATATDDASTSTTEGATETTTTRAASATTTKSATATTTTVTASSTATQAHVCKAKRKRGTYSDREMSKRQISEHKKRLSFGH